VDWQKVLLLTVLLVFGGCDFPLGETLVHYIRSRQTQVLIVDRKNFNAFPLRSTLSVHLFDIHRQRAIPSAGDILFIIMILQIRAPPDTDIHTAFFLAEIFEVALFGPSFIFP
jgi:hypothetical protein